MEKYKEIINVLGYRKEDLPKGTVVRYMDWENCYYSGYKIDEEVLQKKLPVGFEVELIEGQAWLGFSIFDLNNLRFLPFDSFKFWKSFVQYGFYCHVTHKGKRGIYFFEVVMSSMLGVKFGRKLEKLPSDYMKMQSRFVNNKAKFLGKNKYGQQIFDLEFEVSNELLQRTDFDIHLLEIFRLFKEVNGKIYYTDYHHKPWELYKIKKLKNCWLKNHVFKENIDLNEPEVHYFCKKGGVVFWGEKNLI